MLGTVLDGTKCGSEMVSVQDLKEIHFSTANTSFSHRNFLHDKIVHRILAEIPL